MTSKTFKSALDSPVTLEVERETHPAGVYLTIGQAAILLGASDAPALALAILEAAGVPWNVDTALGRAAVELDKHVTTEAKRTAEARERAELEAEALELLNAGNAESGGIVIGSLDVLTTTVQQKWLAVARRAREMRAEK